MFKKLAGLTLIVSSLVIGGCDSDDDDADNGSTTDAMTGEMTDGTEGEGTEGEGTEGEGTEGEGTGTDEMTGGEADVPEAVSGVGNSVYDSISNNPELGTLKELIDLADLADTLDNEASEFTVFAPRDSAFANVDAGTLASLQADPAGALASVLTYHVISGTLTAATVTDALSDGTEDLETVNGAVLTATSTDDGIFVGPAKVVATDVGYNADFSVGVVHVIDAVLIPPQ